MRSDLGDLLQAPIWNSLNTQHCHLAVAAGDACRYPAEVAPLAAVTRPNVRQMDQLRSLMVIGESVWLSGSYYPAVRGLRLDETLPCLQMAIAEDALAPEFDATGVESLTCAHSEEMVALTDAAFPGFFRPGTCRMDRYFGFRDSSGKLVAMGGERLKLIGLHEISGVCTHPDSRGKGLAGRLMWHIILEHRRTGVQSWLHVTSGNQHARQLYLEMGFTIIQEVINKMTAT